MKILGPIEVVEIADEIVETEDAATPKPELTLVIDRVLF